MAKLIPELIMQTPQQLLLDVAPQQQYRFDNFVVGGNGLLVEQLKQFCIQDEPGVLYLWGESGAGCSHLLQASCESEKVKSRGVAYLPLALVLEYPPEFLEGYEQLGLLVIDNVQLLQDQALWQQALFHLFNRCLEQGGRLLLAANQPLAALNLELKDLMSRLSLGANYELKLLDDTGKQQVLQSYCQQAGITVTSEVLNFILGRSQRDIAVLKALLDQLAESALREQRAITVPLVKQVTGW